MSAPCGARLERRAKRPHPKGAPQEAHPKRHIPRGASQEAHPRGTSQEAHPKRRTPRGASQEAHPKRRIPRGASQEAHLKRHAPRGMPRNACPETHTPKRIPRNACPRNAYPQTHVPRGTSERRLLEMHALSCALEACALCSAFCAALRDKTRRSIRAVPQSSPKPGTGFANACRARPAVPCRCRAHHAIVLMRHPLTRRFLQANQRFPTEGKPAPAYHGCVVSMHYLTCIPDSARPMPTLTE
ncbi:MAG: hypothetical protein JWN73_3589 [Betaproteobacteria bacterium]|nr:hypothetical protein [Betaproteobacteria bacterium]